MHSILALYITLMPVILAGVMNMIFCKSSLLEATYRPMDAGLMLKDGKRLFGANKTWKGFLGMIVWGALAQILWGLLLKSIPSLEKLHLVYALYENTVLFNLVLGALLGLAYVLFELPNSFIKRRLEIREGKTAENGWKWTFIWIDQIDSLIGCIIILLFYIPLSWQQMLGILILGAGTHLGVNRLLYWAKLRKNRM